MWCVINVIGHVSQKTFSNLGWSSTDIIFVCCLLAYTLTRMTNINKS